MIDLGAVSRQHAQIVKVGNDYLVEDLKSRKRHVCQRSTDLWSDTAEVG